MNESDGIDEALESGMRQNLMIAARLAEAIARRIEEYRRRQEQQLDRPNQELRGRSDAETALDHAGEPTQAQRTQELYRPPMHDQERFEYDRREDVAALAQARKDEWWNNAGAKDIAAVYATAEGWKAHDRAALETSEKIRQEVLTRYGIDTRDVGGDRASLESGIQEMALANARRDAMAISEETERKAAAEHERAMALLVAAQAEELRAQAKTLAPEMERHQVPAEHLANPELARALQNAHHAKTPAAQEAADIEVKERMFLIDQDGINGPDLGQLRKETAATINGAGEEHFQDPDFVKAAQELREARILAEGGFTGNAHSTMEQRYERAEKELFARMEGFGREVENRVTKDTSPEIKNEGLKAETTANADYGTAARQAAFADSLKSTGATEAQIKARSAAERGEGTHPAEAAAPPKGAPKGRKGRRGADKGAERSNSGVTR